MAFGFLYHITIGRMWSGGMNGANASRCAIYGARTEDGIRQTKIRTGVGTGLQGGCALLTRQQA